MSAFTPEQEARIVQIVGEVLVVVLRRQIDLQADRELDDLKTAVAWAIHYAEKTDV